MTYHFFNTLQQKHGKSEKVSQGRSKRKHARLVKAISTHAMILNISLAMCVYYQEAISSNNITFEIEWHSSFLFILKVNVSEDVKNIQRHHHPNANKSKDLYSLS